MKWYKIRIKIISYDIYPFYPIKKWGKNRIFNILDLYDYCRIILKFKKLNWSSNDIWKMTMFAGCLNDAVNILLYKLIGNSRIGYSYYSKIRKLIYKGYERHWEM